MGHSTPRCHYANLLMSKRHNASLYSLDLEKGKTENGGKEENCKTISKMNIEQKYVV